MLFNPLNPDTYFNQSNQRTQNKEWLTDAEWRRDRPVAAQTRSRTHHSIASALLIREAAGQRQQDCQVQSRTDLLSKRRKQWRKGLWSSSRLLNIKTSPQGSHPITLAMNEDHKAFTPRKGSFWFCNRSCSSRQSKSLPSQSFLSQDTRRKFQTLPCVVWDLMNCHFSAPSQQKTNSRKMWTFYC